MTWSVTVNGHKLDPSISLATSKFPATLKYDDFKELVTVVTKYRVCCGHPDDAFVEMGYTYKRGKFMSIGNKVVATLDSRFPVVIDATVTWRTVRHVKCELLTTETGFRCEACSGYRDNLRAMYSNFSKRRKRSTIGTCKRHKKELS